MFFVFLGADGAISLLGVGESLPRNLERFACDLVVSEASESVPEQGRRLLWLTGTAVLVANAEGCLTLPLA